MAKTPQVIVTLSPQGGLVVELPGIMATRRKIELRTSEAGQSLLRILEAQAADQTEIGLDGAPTVAQVAHWERHMDWPSDRCKFCIAEGRIKGTAPKRAKSKTIVYKRPDGVEVKKLKPGQSGKGVAKPSTKTAEELGL